MIGTLSAFFALALLSAHSKPLPFFFLADDGRHGSELWRTDGTSAGTRLVKDIGPGEKDSRPNGFAVLDGLVYFGADDDRHGVELWKTDGTTHGTVMVKDVHPNGGSFPFGMTPFKGALFFTANSLLHDFELWKTTGTASGTVMVKEFESKYRGTTSACGYLPFGDAVYFWTIPFERGAASTLWKTDGTEMGTTPLVDVRPPTGGFQARCNLTVFKGALYFTAMPDATRLRVADIWRTDGTAAGTTSVIAFRGGYLYGLTAFKDSLYFRGELGRTDTLWKSDGTASGTVQLRSDDSNDNASCEQQSMVIMKDALYFVASRPQYGGCNQLWKTDGTPQGTSLVKDVYPQDKTAGIEHLAAFGDMLYLGIYAKGRGSGPNELWKSDGTAAGTVIVKQIGPQLK